MGECGRIWVDQGGTYAGGDRTTDRGGEGDGLMRSRGGKAAGWVSIWMVLDCNRGWLARDMDWPRIIWVRVWTGELRCERDD